MGALKMDSPKGLQTTVLHALVDSGLDPIPVATAKLEGEAFFIRIGIPWAVFTTMNPRLHDR